MSDGRTEGAIPIRHCVSTKACQAHLPMLAGKGQAENSIINYALIITGLFAPVFQDTNCIVLCIYVFTRTRFFLFMTRCYHELLS